MPTHAGLAELLRALGGIKNPPSGSGIIQSTSAEALAYLTGRRAPPQYQHLGAQVIQLCVVGPVIVPCIWEVYLIRGLASVLATRSATAGPTAYSVLHSICRCSRCCCSCSAALLLLMPALSGSL